MNTEAQAQAAAQAQPQVEEVTVQVTVEELNMIGAGLGKLPYENVTGLISKLRQQFQVWQQAKAAMAAPVASVVEAETLVEPVAEV